MDQKSYNQAAVGVSDNIKGKNSANSPQKRDPPQIREDLVIELDYKTVKKEVWARFMKIYTGGPPVVREKPYIYSAVAEDNLKYPSPLKSNTRLPDKQN